MADMVRLYSSDFDFMTRDILPYRQYLFAASARTGSTYLSLLMWKSGLLGAPMEYLNFDNSSGIFQRLGNGDPVLYWQELKRHRSTVNGVFGFKMFVGNYKNTLRLYPELVSHIYGDPVIYLQRRDKIAQAVSLLKAIQSKSWFSVDPLREAPQYDFAKLLKCYQQGLQQDEEWQKIFALTEARVIDLVYEDYILEPPSVVDHIIDEMKLDRSQACEVPDFELIEKQADHINQEWYERFKMDFAKL